LFPNRSSKSEMQLLFTSLFVSLLFNTLTDHLRIQPYCVKTVALGPKVIAPVGLRLQLRELLEYSYCRAR